ncbi:MAG: helix-turn-helix domain-containing protein, partial [Terriglobia bacterium]
MAIQFNTHAFHYYLRLKKVQKYVEEHYQEALSLRTAAGIACMEAKSFSKFFHKKVGITFKSYVTQKRIFEAMELMRSSDHQSITQIAFCVGFSDLRTFERAFKK